MKSTFLEGPRPIAFAHRGGSDSAENALAAFEAVRTLGFRYVETDVRASHDGVPFIFHDAELTRMTGNKARISQLTSQQIRGERLHGRHQIPTLKEALQSFPDMHFNIDLKEDSAVRPVALLLKEETALSRVCITSFSDRRLAAARRLLGPDVCYGLGVIGVTRAILASLLGDWIAESGAEVLQVPLTWHSIPLVSAKVVARAHRLGLSVHVWTLNDGASIEKALDLDVDGIMTDRPELLKGLLVARGVWS